MSLKKHFIDSIKKAATVKKETSLGTLKFSVLYNSSLQHLTVHLVNASNLPARDSNGLSDPYVKIHLLPSLAKVNKNEINQ